VKKLNLTAFSTSSTEIFARWQVIPLEAVSTITMYQVFYQPSNSSQKQFAEKAMDGGAQNFSLDALEKFVSYNIYVTATQFQQRYSSSMVAVTTKSDGKTSIYTLN